jgi:hypothetical protein
MILLTVLVLFVAVPLVYAAFQYAGRTGLDGKYDCPTNIDPFTGERR